MSIWYILWSFWILEYFVTFWYIFPSFGMSHKKNLATLFKYVCSLFA
jgi:hypothetical protein